MRVSGLIFLIFVLGFPTLSRAQSSHDTDTRELERLEKVWNDAQLKGDADALAALWADDLEVTVPRMPVMTKTEALNAAHSGHIKFSRYETSNLHIRVYGDAAVAAGNMVRTRSMDGREVTDNWRFTKTYIKESDGKWRVVAFQASEAPATP